MDDLLQFLAFMVTAIVGIALAIFLCMVLWAAWPARETCQAFGEGMKTKTEYRFWYGCFVTMPNGEILPESIARDVLKQRYAVEVKQR